MSNVVRLRLDGMQPARRAGLDEGSGDRPEAVTPLDEILGLAAARDRVEADGFVRRWGKAVGGSIVRSFGPERARRHARVFVEAVREVVGI